MITLKAFGNIRPIENLLSLRSKKLMIVMVPLHLGQIKGSTSYIFKSAAPGFPEGFSAFHRFNDA